MGFLEGLINFMQEANKNLEASQKRTARDMIREKEKKIRQIENSGRTLTVEQQNKIRNVKENLSNFKKAVDSGYTYSQSTSSRSINEVMEERITSPNKSQSMIGVKRGISLKKAADASYNPNQPGVYILRMGRKIMKVGSAEIGVQKRMQQYYNLNTSCGLNEYITEENRNSIFVTWQVCPKEKCNELESKLFDKYSNEEMPWARRRPHSSDDTWELLI